MCYGDIKPENFVLKHPYPEPQTTVLPEVLKGHMILKAVDFGSATMNVGSEKLRGEIGSPLYRAPEAHEGGYGLEVDVWSVGILVCTLAILHKHIHHITARFCSSVEKPML